MRLSPSIAVALCTFRTEPGQSFQSSWNKICPAVLCQCRQCLWFNCSWILVFLKLIAENGHLYVWLQCRCHWFQVLGHFYRRCLRNHLKLETKVVFVMLLLPFWTRSSELFRLKFDSETNSVDTSWWWVFRCALDPFQGVCVHRATQRRRKQM